MQTLGGTLAIQMYSQEIKKCLCSKRKEKNSQPPLTQTRSWWWANMETVLLYSPKMALSTHPIQ